MSTKPAAGQPAAPKPEPGAEAAEPSPGDKQRSAEPSAEDLEPAERMYRDAAKKLADEGAADLDKPLVPTR